MRKLLLLPLLMLTACHDTALPDGRYIRLQCFTPQNNFSGFMEREKLENNFRFVGVPCIFEGLNELPQAPEPTPTASPEVPQ